MNEEHAKCIIERHLLEIQKPETQETADTLFDPFYVSRHNQNTTE